MPSARHDGEERDPRRLVLASTHRGLPE